MPFVLLKHFLSSRNAICAWYLFWNFLPGVHYKENYKAPRKSGRVRSWPEDEPFWMALWACDILTGGTCFGIFRCPESAWKLEAWIDHLHVCTLCLICFFFGNHFLWKQAFILCPEKASMFLTWRIWFFLGIWSMLMQCFAPGLSWVLWCWPIRINLPSWSQLNSAWI